MGETPEWDAVSARICKLEMPTAGEVMDLFGAYGKLLIERDALAAELKAVRAGLPRWRKVSDGHLRLHYGSKDFVAGVQSQNNGLWSVHTMVICGRLFPSCEAAMLAVTEALGLPSCEVEGE